MRVIGTAGHVDHGKSTLVRALTGIDPDRLKEEKKRQMTIDLGFAWYESQLTGAIGIVDVPGHRDFIENMLAGVGGIDAVLLVIAADEGVMPQTREHLAIIDLLQIRNGLVVLTKADLVNDPGWFDLVELDIREVLTGSVLENAPLLRVSAVTGEGIVELKRAIDEMLITLGPRVNSGKPRLPVDRVFSITGFGTVVTGTLSGGSFKLEEMIEILPAQRQGRIRGLQTHKQQENEAYPGSRVAINISGIDTTQVKRGDTIARPGTLRPTRRIDGRLEIIPDAPLGVKHDDEVKLFIASTESQARIRVIGKSSIDPGDWGWVQIETEKEIVALKDDRFIIRRMSPAQTIGGGYVIDAHPIKRYKLNDDQVVARFESRTSSSAQDIILAYIEDHPFAGRDAVLSAVKEDFLQAEESLDSLIRIEKVKVLPSESSTGQKCLAMNTWQGLTRKFLEILTNFHSQNPLRMGIQADDVARRLKLPANEYRACLQEWQASGMARVQDGLISLSHFEIKYSATQNKHLAGFWKIIEKDPFNPPNVSDARQLLTDELFQSLVDQGELVQVSPDVFIGKDEYEQMLEYVQVECARGVLLSLAQFRDHFSTSRKYSQAFLEHLDRKGVTIRDGEGRKLKKK